MTNKIVGLLLLLGACGSTPSTPAILDMAQIPDIAMPAADMAQLTTSCTANYLGSRSCEDDTGSTRAQIAEDDSACSYVNGAIIPYPCSRVSSVGGCHKVLSTGETYTVWLYSPGFTTSSAMQKCSSQAGETYVAP